MSPSTAFDIPIGSTSHPTTPLGMLARTSPPAKPASSLTPTKLASKMNRAASTRRSALDRAVSFARSHLTSVHESVRRKSLQDAQQREELAAKLRTKLLACETRRSAELARRGSGGGVKRNRSNSSVSSLSSTSSNESVALDELQDVVARFAALDLVKHDECSRTLDELVAHIEDSTTMDVTRELLNEIALVAAMHPASTTGVGRRRKATRKRSHESLKSDLSHSSTSSAPSSPASDEGILMDGVPELLLESNPFDTRTFLAAMATSLFPSQVLRAEHPMDDMLFDKTTHMMDTFARLISHPTLRRVHAFVSSWTLYAAQFAEWKLASQQTLIHELIAHYLDVDRMWLEARPRFTAQPASAPVLTAAVEYVQGLRNRQVMILNRLDRFGGQEAREALARSRDAACGFDLVKDDMHVLLGPKLGALIKKSKQNSVLKAADSALDLVDEEALAKSEKAQQFMRDVQAAHDLYLDGAGEGSEAEEAGGEEKHVEKTLKRAFRVQKQALFRRGEMEPWLVECLQLLCQNIANSTPNPTATTSTLSGICDLTWIATRVSQYTYTSTDLADVLSHLTTHMRTLCSPARDPLLSSRAPAHSANSDDVVAYLFHLLDVSQLMRADLARARRAAVLPDLAKVIVALERKHFEAQIAAVPVTKQWLAAAMESAMMPATGSIYRHIFDSAVIQLVLCPPADMPETFHLDTARLTHLAEHIHRLLLAATLVTHAKQRAPSAIGSGPLVALVHAGHTRDAIDLVLETVRTATSRKHLVDSLVTQVAGVGMSRIVAKCVGKADPVYKVLARRVEADLRGGLMGEGEQAQVSVCKALEVVGDRMGKVLGKVVRMARLNRVVYAEWYDRVLDEVVGEHEARSQVEREE